MNFIKKFFTKSDKPLNFFYYDGTINGVMWSANAGDALNKPLGEMLSGRKIKCTLTAKKSDTVYVPIGSLMTLYKPLPNCHLRFWGTGAFRHIDKPIKGDVRVYALRGKLSKASMEKRLDRKLNTIVLGDPGLLAPAVLDKIPKKVYSLGIIPHHAAKVDLHDYCNIPGAVIIDTELPPVKFVREVAKCKVILSEAMHGLVIADSLHIPNARIAPFEKSGVLGNFKFRDYYSVFNLPLPLTFDLKKQKIRAGDVQKIIKNYRVPADKISKIQRELVRVCPFATDAGRELVMKKLQRT